MTTFTEARALRVAAGAALAGLLLAASAAADFAEVSGPGEEPFLLFKDADWTWEDLAAGGLSGITYAVFRSVRPDAGFGALRDGYLAPSWSGDPELPSDVGESVFFYLVTANDGTEDSSPGDDTEADERTVDWPPRCGGGGAPLAEAVPLTLRRLPVNFASPTFVTAPEGDDRLFVVERSGRIRIFRDGDVVPDPFLDITDRVRTGSERGLLGLAFHPQFATNGLLYVHYSSSVLGSCPPLDRDHCAVIAEFSVGGDPDRADAATERQVLVYGQPNGNHDGGWIAFGPDDHLYAALGDGGGGGDPDETGQDSSLLLGSILRLDVDGRDPGLEYAIPPDNPFAGMAGVREEIWIWGVRNPWRNSFDRETGDLYVADVGQNEWEEVNVAPAAEGGGRGLNYGWDLMEGTRCFEPPAGCDMTGLTLPVVEYPHEGAFCSGSITGGYVYRGCRLPFWHGTYLFADYCLDRISSFTWDGAAAIDLDLDRADLSGLSGIVSFGEDSSGEIYVVEQGGAIWQVVPDF